MNKKELIEQFTEWRDNDENKKIIAAVLALPESSVDDEILSWLAQAYIDKEEYKRAIAVLDSIQERMDSDYKWQFMMGLALLRAADDDECYDDDDLRRNILERAKVCLARGMNMNPPDDIMDTADRYMEEIESMLDEIDGPPEEDYSEDIETYDDDELDVLEEHIKEYYGDFPTVFHEITSNDIHCDIACIPPTEERNFYTLVTMGMGAHIMDIPDALPADENGRAELLICLPPNWKLGESGEEWFWPISLLKDLARLPKNTNSWLGWGHSVDHQNFVAPNAKFCGSLLIYPENVPDGAEYCVLPNGDKVNFFEIIPLYREEMEYKINNNTKALLERMKDVSHIVDVNRPNCCEDMETEPGRTGRVIDSVENHSRKIRDKGLKLDEINSCNHIAIFMRWCIERGLIALQFYEHCSDIVDGVNDGTQTDIRRFIIDYFDGNLEPYQLSYMGSCFAEYYYNWDNEEAEFFYPADVDAYAEKYFGTERYNSEEFQDEAYLFVPFDEEYYKGMTEYIERAFHGFLPGFSEYQYNSDLEATEKAEKRLNVEFILPNYDKFASSFDTISYNAKAAGFTAIPIIIDENVTIDSQENVEIILTDASDTFLMPVAITILPSAEPIVWAEKNFSDKKPVIIPANERIISLQNFLKETYGDTLAVFTFDGESESLLLPLENGDYILFSK